MQSKYNYIHVHAIQYYRAHTFLTASQLSDQNTHD